MHRVEERRTSIGGERPPHNQGAGRCGTTGEPANAQRDDPRSTDHSLTHQQRTQCTPHFWQFFGNFSETFWKFWKFWKKIRKAKQMRRPQVPNAFAKGRTGDCLGPHRETSDGRNVTSAWGRDPAPAHPRQSCHDWLHAPFISGDSCPVCTGPTNAHAAGALGATAGACAATGAALASQHALWLWVAVVSVDWASLVSDAWVLLRTLEGLHLLALGGVALHVASHALQYAPCLTRCRRTRRRPGRPGLCPPSLVVGAVGPAEALLLWRCAAPCDAFWVTLRPLGARGPGRHVEVVPYQRERAAQWYALRLPGCAPGTWYRVRVQCVGGAAPPPAHREFRFAPPEGAAPERPAGQPARVHMRASFAVHAPSESSSS